MTPAFVHDHADYVDDRLPTPPLSLLILAPFTWLSRPAAQFAWVCVKLPLACFVFAFALAIVRRCGAQLTPPARALVLAGGGCRSSRTCRRADELCCAAPLMAGLYWPRTIARGRMCRGSLLAWPSPSGDARDLRAYFLWKRRWTIAASASPAWASGSPCRRPCSAGIRICAG